MRLLTVCLLGLLATPAPAGIYRYTDDQGRTVFTDQPPEHRAAERVEPSPLNLISPPSPPPAGQRTTDAPAIDGDAFAGRYTRLEILNLPDGQALRANDGAFDVQVALEPALAPGHSLRLLVDGVPHGPTVSDTLLPARQIERGTHSLVVQVLDAGGLPLQQSDAVTITVQRISVNSPARPKAHP